MFELPCSAGLTMFIFPAAAGGRCTKVIRELSAGVMLVLIGAAPALAQCQANEWAKLLAADGAASDEFGCSVAVCGDTCVLGAHFDNDNGNRSGSAYVFQFNGSTWLQEQKLLAPDGAADERFGHAVAISGNTVVVGAPYDQPGGSAYVFVFDGSGWVMAQKLLASDQPTSERFGWTVAIDNNIILVGDPYWSAAYLFAYDGEWQEVARLTASDHEMMDDFGRSVAISGLTVLVGAPFNDDLGSGSGSAYVFCPGEDGWIEHAKLLPTDGGEWDYFGWSVGISGDSAVIGATHDGDLGLYSGSAYIFQRSGSIWNQEQKLLASDGAAGDEFGCSVGISGETGVIGARGNYANGYQTGSAYVFGPDPAVPGSWTEQGKLAASDGAGGDGLGWSVAISGSTAVSGAPYRDELGFASGSAYCFHEVASDCNNNQIIDICDIAEGTSQDANANGIPDECDCPGDLDGDWDIDLSDLAQLLSNYGITSGASHEHGDVDFDGDVDLADLAALLAVYGTMCG